MKCFKNKFQPQNRDRPNPEWGLPRHWLHRSYGRKDSEGGTRGSSKMFLKCQMSQKSQPRWVCPGIWSRYNPDWIQIRSRFDPDNCEGSPTKKYRALSDSPPWGCPDSRITHSGSAEDFREDWVGILGSLPLRNFFHYKFFPREGSAHSGIHGEVPWKSRSYGSWVGEGSAENSKGWNFFSPSGPGNLLGIWESIPRDETFFPGPLCEGTPTSSCQTRKWTTDSGRLHGLILWIRAFNPGSPGKIPMGSSREPPS